jgi:hypothetical protein
MAPKHAAEAAAGILASLIGMKHQPFGMTAASQGRLQGIDHKLSIGLIANRRTNNTAVAQIENDGEVMPTISRPDIGNIASPNPIRSRDVKLPVQEVWNIYPGLAVLLVRARARLTRSQPRLTHEAPNFKAPDRKASEVHLVP